MRRYQLAPGLRLHLHSSSETLTPAALAALTELLAPDYMDGSGKAKVSLTLGQVGSSQEVSPFLLGPPTCPLAPGHTGNTRGNTIIPHSYHLFLLPLRHPMHLFTLPSHSAGTVMGPLWPGATATSRAARRSPC